MAIDDRVAIIVALLRKIQDYNRLVINDGFEEATVDDLQGNAKDICDQIKDEITGIKSEIDGWS